MPFEVGIVDRPTTEFGAPGGGGAMIGSIWKVEAPGGPARGGTAGTTP